MSTRAPLTNRQAAWLALQLANPVGQSSNVAGNIRQGQLGLGADSTRERKEQDDKQQQA